MTVLTGCAKHEEVFFNQPFVSIADENGASKTTISKDANNLISILYITLSASEEKFQSPVEVSYEVTVGNGLTEGKDFKIQSTTMSPITFTPGIYRMPVRIQWLKNPDFDPQKDCELKIELTGCSIEGALLGYPGPDSIKRSYLFIKQ